MRIERRSDDLCDNGAPVVEHRRCSSHETSRPLPHLSSGPRLLLRAFKSHDLSCHHSFRNSSSLKGTEVDRGIDDVARPEGVGRVRSVPRQAPD
jgi:hypothetical protein